jgi:hypothetical protein
MSAGSVQWQEGGGGSGGGSYGRNYRTFKLRFCERGNLLQTSVKIQYFLRNLFNS